MSEDLKPHCDEAIAPSSDSTVVPDQDRLFEGYFDALVRKLDGRS